MTDYTAYYDSPLGTMMMTSDGKRLTGLSFSDVGNGEWTKNDVQRERNNGQGTSPVFQQAKEWLDMFFSGKEPDFTPTMLMVGTPFRKRVWELLLAIPFGHTQTYGDIAQRLGNTSARAVGNAVGHNPFALIVPCHRIVGKGGSLTGYAAGIDRKAWLLRHERIEIEKL